MIRMPLSSMGRPIERYSCRSVIFLHVFLSLSHCILWFLCGLFPTRLDRGPRVFRARLTRDTPHRQAAYICTGPRATAAYDPSAGEIGALHHATGATLALAGPVCVAVTYLR